LIAPEPALKINTSINSSYHRVAEGHSSNKSGFLKKPKGNGCTSVSVSHKTNRNIAVTKRGFCSLSLVKKMFFDFKDFDADLIHPLSLREKNPQPKDDEVDDDEYKRRKLKKIIYELDEEEEVGGRTKKKILSFEQLFKRQVSSSASSPPSASQLLQTERRIYLGSFDAAEEREELLTRYLLLAFFFSFSSSSSSSSSPSLLVLLPFVVLSFSFPQKTTFFRFFFVSLPSSLLFGY
jgi:hypothetical protein